MVNPEPDIRVAVLISADVEWRVIRRLYPEAEMRGYPYGEWFTHELLISARTERVRFVHGGWGKISAAASTQYIVDHWSPSLIVNLGTCGGFEGEIERDAIVLVDRTIVYDIVEQMGDYDDHIAHYATAVDLSWLGTDYPQPVLRTVLISGDRDLVAAEIPQLQERYHAVAGDWESGAIAWVAARNGIRLLILRAVTDLVGSSGGEAYSNLEFFESQTERMLGKLNNQLPRWIALATMT